MKVKTNNKQSLKIILVLILILGWSQITTADDWPQWRGLNRDGSSPEKDLLKKWPDNGPELIFRRKEVCDFKKE